MPDMDWREGWRSIIGRLRLVGHGSDEQALLDALAGAERPTVLGFVNAHCMNLVARDADFQQALAGADILLRDGKGMEVLLRRLGLAPGLNMNGTDFIVKLLAAFKGRPVALWGTREPYLDEAARLSEALFGVRVVSVQHGFADADSYLDLARQARPELIVLGMGMPRQELLAARLAKAGGPCVIVCGGAILDFLGGKVSRAPAWMRRLGFEWLYRLLLEPRRLFRRYVLGNPAFLLRTLFYRGAVATRSAVKGSRPR